MPKNNLKRYKLFSCEIFLEILLKNDNTKFEYKIVNNINLSEKNQLIKKQQQLKLSYEINFKLYDFLV